MRYLTYFYCKQLRRNQASTEISRVHRAGIKWLQCMGRQVVGQVGQKWPQKIGYHMWLSPYEKKSALPYFLLPISLQLQRHVSNFQFTSYRKLGCIRFVGTFQVLTCVGKYRGGQCFGLHCNQCTLLPPYQKNSEANDASFKSPDIELFESEKKAWHHSWDRHIHLIKKVPFTLKII